MAAAAQQPDTRRNPLAGDGNAVAAGQRVFDRTCQSCHGPAGRGDSGPPLTSGSFTRGSNDDDLFRTIRNGVPGSQMPPFQQLSDNEIWQVASYLRSLAAPADPRRPVVVARTQDGREIQGVRVNEDTFTLQVIDASGGVHTLNKQTLSELRVEPTLVLPAEYVRRAPGSAGLSTERLVNAAAEPHNWVTYWGDYGGRHYSALKQIDITNVHRLHPVWSFPMPGDAILEATPLVIDGVMYTSQPGSTFALDAQTGRQIWRHDRPQKVRNPNEINPFNRGVAVSGHRVFVGTLDAALMALDSRTGERLWETQVADSLLGYSITSAPLAVKDMVIVGVAGGEFGARGFLDAYDAATGKRVWRWYSVPGPGEFGNETWAGESWKLGGSPTWLTGSYDPALNLVYWTVGNPGPQIDRSGRGDLDNLFSDAVVAIDGDTGARRWHYQFTPNDGHDWDSCEDVILVDREWRGRMRKLLIQADRNGFLYVLDRTNGEFLAATPFVYANWNTGFDTKGRPLMVPGSNSSASGSFFVYPTVGGATNFQAPSYSPLTGWVYVQYFEGGQRYVSAPQAYEAGKLYIGRTAPTGPEVGPKPNEPGRSAGIRALDPTNGKTMWDFKIFQRSLAAGVLATGGQVLFGAIRDGNVVALDARSGKYLWHFQTGANVSASPMTYEVGGTQFMAISAGNTLYAFALPK